MTKYIGGFTNRSSEKHTLIITKGDGKDISKDLTITGLNITSNSEATNIYVPIRYTSLDFSILTDDIDIYKGAFLNCSVELMKDNDTLWRGKIIEVPQNQAFNNSVEVLSFSVVDELTLLKSEPVDLDKTGYESFLDFITVECLPVYDIFWADFMTLKDGTSLLNAKFNYANYIESSDTIVYKSDILESILEYCGVSLFIKGTNCYIFNPIQYTQDEHNVWVLSKGEIKGEGEIKIPQKAVIDQSTIAQAGVQINWQPQINSITLTGTYKSLDDAKSSSSSSQNNTSWLYNYYISNDTTLLFNKDVSVVSKPNYLTYTRYRFTDNDNKTYQAEYQNDQVSIYGRLWPKNGAEKYTGTVTPEEPLNVETGKITGDPEYVIFSSANKGVFADVYDTFYKMGQYSYQKYGFKPDAEYYCYPVQRYAYDHGFSNIINTDVLSAVGNKSLKEYITGFTEGDYRVYYYNTKVGEYESLKRILNNYETITLNSTDSTYSATYSQDNNSIYAYNTKDATESQYLSLFGCCELSSANKVASHKARYTNTTAHGADYVYTGVITETNVMPDSSPSFNEKTVIFGTYGLTSVLNKGGKVNGKSVSDFTDYISTLKEGNSTLTQYPLITKTVTVESLPLKNDANSTKTLSFLISGSIELNPYMYGLTNDSSMLSKTVDGTGTAKMLIKIDLYGKDDKLLFSSFKAFNPSKNPTGQTQKADYSNATLECSSGNSVFSWSIKNNVGWNNGVKGSGYIYTPWQEFIVDDTTYSIYDVAYYKYTIYPVAYFEVPALKDSSDPVFPIYSYTQDIKVEIVEGWNKEEEEETTEGDAEENSTTNQVVYYWKNTVNPLVNGTEISLDNKLVTYNENMQSISSPSYDNIYINELSCVGYPDNSQSSEVYRFGQLVDQYSTPSLGCVVPLKGFDAAYKSYNYPFISTNNLMPLSFSYDAVNDINTVTLIEKKELTNVELTEL